MSAHKQKVRPPTVAGGCAGIARSIAAGIGRRTKVSRTAAIIGVQRGIELCIGQPVVRRQVLGGSGHGPGIAKANAPGRAGDTRHFEWPCGQVGILPKRANLRIIDADAQRVIGGKATADALGGKVSQGWTIKRTEGLHVPAYPQSVLPEDGIPVLDDPLGGDRDFTTQSVDIKRDNLSGVVVAIHYRGNANLLLVAQAINGLGLFLRPGQGRQQQRRQNRNDRNNHQQYDKREGRVVLADGLLVLWSFLHTLCLASNVTPIKEKPNSKIQPAWPGPLGPLPGLRWLSRGKYSNRPG